MYVTFSKSNAEIYIELGKIDSVEWFHESETKSWAIEIHKGTILIRIRYDDTGAGKRDFMALLYLMVNKDNISSILRDPIIDVSNIAKYMEVSKIIEFARKNDIFVADIVKIEKKQGMKNIQVDFKDLIKGALPAPDNDKEDDEDDEENKEVKDNG